MVVPSLADYVAAFRQLRDATTHSDLKTATVWVDPGGNPVVFRGRESAVFCVRAQERKLAVKVFLGDFSDRPHRYAAIAAELRRLDLPYIMPFRFAENAINIGGSSYPVGISYWADGELLHHYIEKNLHNATLLRELAIKWLELSQTLSKGGIAHGDLEPNNIVVSETGLKLVDYDDFYVPELQSFPSRTLGSPNFQHPRRNLMHFGPYLDNFSSWVIYTSLVAVSKDRKLWTGVQKDGEQLLFTRADLENPHASELVQRLKDTSDKVRQLALSLENLVSYDVPDVPPLDPGRVVQSQVAAARAQATTLTEAPAQSGQPGPADDSPRQELAEAAKDSALSADTQQGRRDSRSDVAAAAAAPAAVPDPGARPYSATTRALPTFRTQSAGGARYGLWAAALALVGIAAGGFWLTQNKVPSSPSQPSESKTLPTEGFPGGGTAHDTTTGSINLEPENQQGASSTTNSQPTPTPTPTPTAHSDGPPSNDQEEPTPKPIEESPSRQPNTASTPASDASHAAPSSKPPHTMSATQPSQPAKQLSQRRASSENTSDRESSSVQPSPVYTPRPAQKSYTAPDAEWPPKVEPQDESPPAPQLSTHPKFDRIQASRARLAELKAAGVDTTTSRQLLYAVESLAARGNTEALESKLQDLEYRLGLRASKD